MSRVGLIDSQVGRGTYVSRPRAATVPVAPLPSPPSPLVLQASPSFSGAFPTASAAALISESWHYERDSEIAKVSAAKNNEAVDWNGRYSRYVAGLSGLISRLPQFAADEAISFAGGIPAQDFYPSAEFKKIVASILASDRGDRMFDYSPFNGEPELRQSVINHLAKKAMRVEPDQLLILSGSQQGIDLVANLLVDPGDAVLVEEPTYFWAISNFRARQARLIGCRHDAEGINLGEVEAALRRHAPKFLYVMPNNQNPTGLTMSLNRRPRSGRSLRSL